MYRKISGCFEGENGASPVVFLPGYGVSFRKGVIRISKSASLNGTPWAGSARLRRIFQALDEQNVFLVNQIVPRTSPREKAPGMVMEIKVDSSPGSELWEFDFDSGIMKITDCRGMEIEFSGERENTGAFMFRGKRIVHSHCVSGDWQIREKDGIFCCVSPEAELSAPEGEAGWRLVSEKKFAWWHEAFLLTRNLAGLEESERLKLLTAVQQLLMFPEDVFYFDGNFSSWCAAMRKLKFAELLKSRLRKICALSPVWNYNAKCFSGIDDGVRLPQRSDWQGNPLELDWLIALDSAASCLTGVEMFEYCNVMHDMDFLKSSAFAFMKQVMQVVELLIEPENFKLFLRYAPLPGGKANSPAACGRNVDRQLYFIHNLVERLLKACDMLGTKADPVWLDIRKRLPVARGKWELAPDTAWGVAGKKICEMLP